MFHEESIVTTIFKILNLGVFVAATVYLLKKNLGSIRESIAQEQLEEQGLKEENNLLQHAVSQVDSQTVKFKEWALHIERNIDLWKKRVDEECDLKKIEQEKISKKLHGKVKQQAHSIAMSTIQTQVTEQALKESEKKLKQKIVGDQGQKYIQGLMEFLKGFAHES